jgi:hypothetical protein
MSSLPNLNSVADEFRRMTDEAVSKPRTVTPSQAVAPAAVADPYANVPQQLKDLPNWVVWKLEMRDGDLTKIPYNPITGRNVLPGDPTTWATFEQAVKAASRPGNKYKGIGFEFGETPYEGIDFDGLLNADRSADPYALAVLAAAGNPYCEVSPSKTGFHGIVDGHLPVGGTNKFMIRDHYGIEIYDTERYFTVTGEHFSGSGIPKVDSDLIYLLVSQFKDEKFKKLWLGDTSTHGGDHSTADFDLMCRLARLTHNDPVKMDKYFGASALGQRDKWQDRVETYRQPTIKNAIEANQANGKGKPTPAIEFRSAPRTGCRWDYVIAPLDGQKDGWFPLGSISLIGGPSGSGKSTWMFQMLQHQKQGYEFLGHKTFKRLFHVLSADRDQPSVERTLDRMNLLASDMPTIVLPCVFGREAVQTIINEIEKLSPTPQIVFIEGLDMLLDDTNKKSVVSPFLRQLQQVAAHFHTALIGSVGSPKSKQGEAYAAKRDKISGSEAWGRNSETVAVLEFSEEDDGTSPHREFSILPRNAGAEKFSFQFEGGRLVQIQPTVEAEKPILGRPDTAMQVAIRFLERELQDGPRDSKELLRLADEHEGITKGTFYGAARKMKILMHTKDRMWELSPMHAMMEVPA